MKNSKKILDFLKKIKPLKVPNNISIMNPYHNKNIWPLIKKFYTSYYNDYKRRIIILGINPGRLGGGLTGIPFTDPYNLEKYCLIDNSLNKKKEISSKFIYELISIYGGTKKFYNKFFISSVCPFGFIKDNKNFNYYDNDMILKNWEKKIVEWIKYQCKNIVRRELCIIIGKGKNEKFFEKINKEYKFFNEIISLPHPRWILQYRSKQKNIYMKEYINKLNNINND